MATDEFEHLYGSYIDNTYDCVDRIVLNAYFYMAQSGGGFRRWWRDLFGQDDHLDNTHLMRFAGAVQPPHSRICRKELYSLDPLQKG